MIDIYFYLLIQQQKNEAFEKNNNDKLKLEIVEKSRTISTLEDNLKKESKVVQLYKEGLSKFQDKKENEWNNMNRVYIEQIKRLE